MHRVHLHASIVYIYAVLALNCICVTAGVRRRARGGASHDSGFSSVTQLLRSYTGKWTMHAGSSLILTRRHAC